MSAEVEPVRVWVEGPTASSEADLAYWARELADSVEGIELPNDLARPAVRTPSLARVSARLPGPVATRLRRTAANRSPSAWAFAATAVFFGKIANAKRFVIGMTLREGVAPIPVDLDPNETFAKLLARLDARVREGIEHALPEIETIVRKLAITRDPARHPLFEVGFSEGGDAIGDLHVRFDRDEAVDLIYDQLLFSASFAASLLRSLLVVLSAFADDPERVVVGKVGLLTREAGATLLDELCTPSFNWPNHLLLHELFEAKVDQTPDAIAISAGATTLTYAELERRANVVARELRSLGVGADAVVALVFDRTPEMLVAILATLKAGGAYLPIEPESPPDRVAYVLADSGARVILTTSALAPRLTSDAAPILCVDAVLAQMPGAVAPRPLRACEPHHLAYIIYTSGSTGLPKGVLIEHRNVVHLIIAERENFGVRASEALVLLSSYTFDASIDQIWLALTSGAKLVLVDKATILDAALLVDAIARERVTHLDTIPSLLAGLTPAEVPTVKRVVVGGESCSVAIARAWGGAVALYNEYGPTETTVGSLRHRVTDLADSELRVPIGVPLGRTRAYVLDWGGCLVPAGIRGELFIGGAGVTRGYLNREELTRERFLADPFAHAGARMYRTGDLVAWRFDGTVDFLGRVDNQVKVRGFRIELGEIEAQVLKCPDIIDAAVTVVGDSEDTRRVVCHFQARGERVHELTAFLATTLPSYMVPSGFMQLAEMPKTVAGKIDRRKLPRVLVDVDGVVPPANRIEVEVRAIWSAILRLPEDQISVTRGFFELGGHSLLVTRMASRIQKQLGVALRVSAILAAPTIRAIADAIAMAGQEHTAPIAHADLGLALRATTAQRVMYVLQQSNPHNASHNLPLLYEIDGALDRATIERGLRALIERHEALRTGFFFQQGEILQKIAQNAKLTVEEYDLDQHGSGAGAVDLAMAEFIRPFVLEEPPLIRAAALMRAGQPRYLALDMHHMITDGMSVETMLEDFIAIIEGRPLPDAVLHYFDHAAWLESDVWRARVAAAKPYWLDLLGDELPVLELPYDLPRPVSNQYGLAHDVTLELDRDKLAAIARYAKAHEATPFAFFAAVYSLFLSSETGSGEVVFGFPAAGRPHPDFERVVGMFVNLLVFRTRIALEQPFSTFLAEIMTQVRQSLQNEDYPFDTLVEDLKIDSTPGRRPIFETMLSYEGFTPGTYPCGNAILRERRVNRREAMNALAVIIRERADGYTIWFEYSSALFHAGTAERFARAFEWIVDRVLASDDVRLGQLHTLTGEEQQRILATFNATEHALPAVGGVHELFEDHAARAPSAPAVTLHDTTWTYGEVEARANAIADVVEAHGAGRDAIVGILVPPSLDMLTSIVGVLKAGAAFLPIDVSYPLVRKSYLLTDSQTTVLLTKGSHADDLRASFAGAVIDLDDPALYRGTHPARARGVRRGDIAYVIYTSGSTGQPKGVMVEHGNILNFSAWLGEFLGLSPADSLSKYASFGFDSSIGEIIPAFTAGTRLVIVPEDLRLSPDELDAYLAAHAVTVADLPTQFGEQFLQHATRHTLRAVRVGGDKLRTVPASGCALYNEYGPTECTVVSTSFRVDNSYANVPIGRPIWNTQVLILDRLGRLARIGVPGELCIAGAGVARGYLKQHALTAEKFIHHPLARGQRLYRTGDLARFLEDGNLEFLGRIDTQVKVRGFRIELGEIEQALMALAGIRDATVVARENPLLRGDLSLIAFVTGASADVADEAQLQAALARTLPPYMVPSRIVHLDAIPLTSNGKVDKRRLPQVELGTTTAIVEPSTPTERTLRPMYAEVLGLPEAAIGVETNFVALGGHSLKAALLLSAIFRSYGVQLRLAKFLEASSIKEIAAEIDALKSSDGAKPALPKVPSDAALPLTPSQNRILAVQQLAQWSTAYNIPTAWQLHDQVDLDRLAAALAALVDRHDALRASFPSVDGAVHEQFQPSAQLAIGRVHVDDTNLGVTLQELVQPFDLTRAPLMRATIVTTETRKILALDLHHIIADGMSYPILLRDLEAIYDGRAEPRTGPSYADYVAWEQSDEASAKRASEKAWWLERFANPPNQLDLPYDYDRPAHPSFAGEEVSVAVPREVSAAVFALARAQSVTPLNPFLAAWALVLSRLGNNPDVVIGMPAFGRHVPGTEDIVGMFVNTVPLRIKLSARETFRELTTRLGRETAQAFDRQAYHLNDLVVDLGIARDPARNPLFDVVVEWNEKDRDSATSVLGLEELPPPPDSAKFDLQLSIDGHDGQRLSLLFATSLFAAKTAQKFLSHLRRVLEQIAANPDLEVGNISMLQPWERELLLSSFHPADPREERDEDRLGAMTLTDLFNTQVRAAPDAIAIEDRDGAYTYADVDRRAGALARELIAAGVASDDVVALALGRSRELLVAIVGILKAGAAYLPIEPDAPDERASAMIVDSGAKILVTEGVTFGAVGVRALHWDAIDWSASASVASRARPRATAYVIYTSGSTGKPKGVVVEHASAVNYAATSARAFGLTSDDRVLLFSSVTFDASVEQIGIAIASGARLVVPSRDLLLDLEAFETFIADKAVTFMHAAPLFLASFTPTRPLALKWVISGADVCPVPVAERWSKLAAFYNEYGPTETTVAALRHAITPDDFRGSRLAVGRPVAGAKIYILDWTMSLAPLGVAGEMYIGGPGVARGYLNNDALTGERFIANFYRPGERFYKTGDIARWRPDGSVDFLGRVDKQVKIRGYRIELGEIESALLRHPAVAEAAVIVASEGDHKRLSAYVVIRSEATPREIRAFVARLVPSYMVPDAVAVLAALPVTSSGKLDRARLPALQFDEGAIDDAPANETEWKLTAIWSDVLRLPLAAIAARRSFFELGGHSLLIMQVITRVQDAFGVRLVPADVFGRPTIRELAALVDSRGRQTIARIPKLPEAGRYPLSSVQRRMYAIHQSSPDSVSYNIPSVFEVEGRITRERLEEVVRALIQRHASLRMAFVVEHGEPVAIVAPDVAFSVGELTSDDTIEELAERLIVPFDLAVAPLARVHLVARSDGSEVVFVDFHHIIFDGGSSTILWREVREFLAGEVLPPLRIHYGDFAAWQGSAEHQASLRTQRQFWLDRFATLPEPLPLPYDFRRPAIRTQEGELVSTSLTKKELDGLSALSREHNATLFVTLISSFFAFLARIGGVDDLVIGVPTSGRVHPDVQGLIGMFVNTVPWRLAVPADGSFVNFLARAQELSTEFLSREEYQLEAILEDLDVRAEPGHNPLFDVMFSYQSVEPDNLDVGRVRLHEREFGHRTAKMDLTLIATETETGLDLTFEYATELFERATIERLARQFATLLRSILRAPTSPLASLEILTPAERNELLATFNTTAHELPAVAGVHELFASWVARTPDAEAVVCGPVRWTYAEVDRRASHIAAWLLAHGVRVEDRVALLLPPCADQLPAILAALMVGGAFVPIDASYPVGRQSFMIMDSGARALVSLGPAPAELGFAGPHLDLTELPTNPAARVRVDVTRSNAAYIIYTSGSTGKPKGVIAEHGNLLNFAAWYAHDFEIHAGDGVAKYFGFSFDGSMAEVFPACISGARLVVVPADMRLAPQALARYLADNGVRVAAFPTQFGEQFLHVAEPKGLRKVMLGGEKLRTHRAGPWTIINAYGPTETTCASTAYPVLRHAENIPVGKPAWNTQVLVLDKRDRLCPIGIAGELCIAGRGVTRGYLDRPELTSTRYVAHPFEPGARMYRTGDVARWLPDGNLEHLGRIDTQVKIRGYRIELGEIEAALLDQPGITGAVVVDRKDGAGTLALVAFVVATGSIDIAALPAKLAKSLPEHMVPNHFRQLDALPLTSNGKVDRRALPAVELGGTDEVEPPVGELEIQLVSIWARVLAIEPAKISVVARFIDLGGHSLKAIALMTEIYRELAIELSVADVFAFSTVRSMAAELLRRAPKRGVARMLGSARIPRLERSSYPLSSAQRRLFAIHQARPDSIAYNIPSIFEVEGAVTPARVTAVIREMYERHPSFRTSFAIEHGEPVARMSADGPPVVVEVASDETIDELTERLVQPFDLAIAPLARIYLIRRSSGAEVILFDVHHIAFDGTSATILWRDVRDYLAGRALPELPIAYGDFAAWQATPEHRAALASHREFWLEQFTPLPTPISLPYDFRRPAARTYAGDMIAVYLTKAELEALAALARDADTTLFTLLIAAFFVLLSRMSGTDDLVVGVPTAGRAHPDLEHVVGMFVNTVPWRLNVPTDGTFRDFLATAKRMSLEFLTREAYQLESIIEDLGVRADADHNPLFDVMFAHQFGAADAFDAGQVRLHERAPAHRTAKIDLMLTTSETDDGLELAFEYASELFERATIERMAGYCTNLIRGILAAPSAPLRSLEILSAGDRRELVETFNATTRELPAVDGIHQLFEGWAARTPDAEAVRCGDFAFTYREVDHRAERIAAWLGERGIGRGDQVALVLDPCAEQMPAILGVLKAGAAFVPIDASYPAGRQSYMIVDSCARALLTRGDLANAIEFAGPRLDVAQLPAAGVERAPVATTLADAAYVIYTSGSTGKPKGVVVEHRSLLNLALWSVDDNSVRAGDSLSRYFGFSFDPTMSEVFPACITGARLVIVPAELRLDPKGISAYLANHRVAVAAFPTQFGEQFLQTTHNPGFRRVTLCGEKLRQHCEGPWTLVNGYGPTETTCYSTSFVVAHAYDNIPIGKPLWNTQIFVLDRYDRLCPIGVAGQLCIAGTGVARGYLNKPELTAERFVAHPFDPTARMYLTGDVARWLPDGNLEYLGRADKQVKIRGFRVELGEIEAALLALPAVTDAAVIDAVEKSGATALVAYVVASTAIEAIDIGQIKAALAKTLPEFIVPGYYVQLEALPLTPNGKVDRRALPPVAIGDGAPIEPPATELERVLAAIWARVLGVDKARLGVTTHFVDLGGHSLKAIALVSELYRELGVELKVSDVFRHPTVREMAAAIATRAPARTLPPIERATPAQSYRASSVQERMYFLQQVDPSGVSYNLASLFAVSDGVSRDDVARALATLAERHVAFRTSFLLVGNSTRVRVAPEVSLPLPVVTTSEAAREQTVAELTRPFDLALAPLARATWIHTEAGAYLFFDMHHSVTDGGSVQILLDELTKLVRGEPLPEVACDLIDCAVWEQSEPAVALLAAQREHWRTVFADGVPTTEIITDFPRPTVADPAGATVSEDVSASTLATLKLLGKHNGLSLFNLCLAALDVFLARITRQDDIVVGTPMTGRWHPDMQNVCGMFVNTLVLRNHVAPSQPFLDFARGVTQRSLEALDHQAFPFADLVELVGAERRGDRNPLFDVMLVVTEAHERRSRGDDVFSSVVVDVPFAKFDLTLSVDELDDRLVLTMEYRTSLFRRSTIECFLRCLRALLDDIATRPSAALAELSILAPEDRQRAAVEFNQTDVAYAREPAVQELFERVAAAQPTARALVEPGRAYSYGEVEVAANRLAHRLIGLGVQRESVVAVLSEPSAALIIAELAILKAGGAFLPLDHRYPRERLEFTLRDSGARILLAPRGLDVELEWPGARLVLGDALFQDGASAPPALPRSERDLAYIIYTSGSTGRPKGVAIEHRSLINYVHRSIETFGLTPADRASKYAGVAFDASVMETFPALCSGAELHLVPEDIRLSPPGLAAWMASSGITWTFLPTQLGEAFMREPSTTGLRWLVVGGDRLRKVAPVAFGVINEYGPTEFTVSATTFLVDAQSENIPIGKPNPNTKVFVLDPRGELCPPGVPGELCLVGAGIARGYVGAPELTEKKFVTHALAGDGKMYKTGDLGRYRDDGNLEFLGRIDSQVKIRGFRIELGEIEQAMLEIPGITSSVAIDVPDAAGQPSLCGYFVARDDVTPDIVRDALARRLPDYMVPVGLVRIAAIPFTTNGKVDRKRLPIPDLRRRERTAAPPETVAQGIVLGAFERVLALTGLGIDDDFFELGGNSLKAIAVVAALANDFKIAANDVFRLRTARAIARDVPQQRGDLKARLREVSASLREAPTTEQPAELVDSLAVYRAQLRPYHALPLAQKEAYRNILLTGATGFLGCFLLRDLLRRTDAKIYVTVRAKSRKEAWERVTSRAAYYFGAGAFEYVRRRIIVVPSNLEEPKLGLADGTYDTLARTIDCIVHAAALTKHYGDYSSFVASNVDATQNLIALARTVRCPFNLVSTTSVANGEIDGVDHALFGEFDCDIGQKAGNYYVRTKLDAEKAALVLRRDGGTVNIFRVGFLTGDSRTLRFQQNADDSGFVQKLRSFIALGAMPETAMIHSHCPVNEVSDAILRLMFTSALQNETHHVERFMTREDAQRVTLESRRLRTMPDAEFYDWLADHLDDPEFAKAATAMLLHEGLLDDAAGTDVVTVSERTNLLLDRLEFRWSSVSPASVWSLIDPDHVPAPTPETLPLRPSVPIIVGAT